MGHRELDVEFERVRSVPRNARRVPKKGRSTPISSGAHHSHGIVAEDAEVYEAADSETFLRLKGDKQVRLSHEADVALPKGTYRIRISRPTEGDVMGLLREAGIDTSADELLRWISEGLQSVTATKWHVDPSTQFTEGELQALDRGGFSLKTPGRDPVLGTIAHYAILLHESISAAEAAKRLRVNPSRVRQLLGDRSLFGVKAGREWRIPVFQFSDNRLIPGIDVVLRHLSSDLHPVEVWEWFQSPNPDLDVHDASVTPLQWLRSGGDPQRAADIAADV